jgi:sucrose-6-phosphate hydrolase SacC (GH32 family)
MNGPAFPGMLFSQQMTVPSELTLHSTPRGPRLHMNPIKELETLRTKTCEWTDVPLKDGQNPLSEIRGDLFDLEVEFEPSADSETIFDLRGIKVLYDNKTHSLSVGDKKTELKPIHGVIRLRILLDRASIEVYGNDGCVYIPHVEFPAQDNLLLTATSRGCEVKANYLRVHQMKSIW